MLILLTHDDKPVTQFLANPTLVGGQAFRIQVIVNAVSAPFMAHQPQVLEHAQVLGRVVCAVKPTLCTSCLHLVFTSIGYTVIEVGKEPIGNRQNTPRSQEEKVRRSQMNKRVRFLMLIAGLLVGLLTMTACASKVSALGPGLTQAPAGDLSEVEAEGIRFMREEEKLARDVYLTLYGQWDMQAFTHIADSENTHMEAIKTLIDRYGLDDPAAGREIGEFANKELQALYNQLVEQGSRSLVDALKVGATIEEIDILDLQEYISQTDKPDIQTVYGNLLRGSRNHLRAFVSSLEGQGVTYEPSYLSPEQVQEIINSGVERGKGRGSQRGQGGQGSRGSQGSRGGTSGRGSRGS
jgi:hypothetical protein